MDTIRICPQCRKPLPPEAPQGLCPVCLARVALPSEATTVVGPEPATAEPRRAPSAASEPPTPAALAPHFPQLEILELLGVGGMGMVYKARQPQLDRFVALKILSPEIAARDAAFAERFLREARALARLNHPNIIAVYDFGQAGGFYYFIMEFVDGANLRQLLANHEITPREALSIVPKICDALQFAHDEGVMHRDIKPENILIDRKGRVKIADFGLAKLFGAEQAAHSTLTHTGVVMGTPRYMAPEQIEKPQTVDHRADIYSLGVVFYEMLTGELPLGRFDPPSHKVGIDVRLDEVVLRSLEKKPERRYQRASEVKTDVEMIGSTAPPGAPSVPASAPPRADLHEAGDNVRAAATALFMIGLFGFPLLILLVSHALDKAGIKLPVISLVGNPVFFVLCSASTVMIMYAAAMMRRLRRIELARVACVMAMVPITSPLFLLGIPVGIWCLVALNKAEVKEAFRAAARARAAAAAGGGNPPPPAAANDADALVRGPAAGLIAAGALNWLGGIAVFAVLSYHEDRDSGFKGALGAVAIGVMVLSTLIFAGAFRMMRLRSYGLANLSSVLAMLATPGNIIGLPIGIWSLMTLARREVKDAFRQRAAEDAPAVTTAPSPRFSRKAIAGAVWAGFALVALPSYFVTRPVIDARLATPQHIEVASLAPVPMPPSLLAQAAPPQSSWGEKSKVTLGFILAMIVLAIGLTSPIGTTVLGLLALHDIRHSKGTITGLPLALADALLFPLLALGSLFYWLCHTTNRIARDLAPSSPLFDRGEWVGPAAVVLTLIVGSLLVWLAWRAASKPAAAFSDPPQATPPPAPAGVIPPGAPGPDPHSTPAAPASGAKPRADTESPSPG